MNFLAHAYLSFGFEPLIIGNLISDFVKGKRQFDYPLPIQAGISLHRKIDIFTDHHIATSKAVKLLKPAAGRYAPVFLDIVYDHFLAIDDHEFPLNSLSLFSRKIYDALSKNEASLPLKFRNMLPYMIRDNWLENYKYTESVSRSFSSVYRRAKYLEKNGLVFETFLMKYQEFKEYYDWFFPEVKLFALTELNKYDKSILY